MATTDLKAKYISDEVILFIAGALVMIVEIVGARVITPYCGASTYVWTSIIGVILGSLAYGYYWGGKVADIDCSDNRFARIFLFATLFLIISNLFSKPLLGLISLFSSDLKVQAVLASFFLFAAPAFFLAAVSPFVVKRRTVGDNNLGLAVGRLYALGTLGSIFGTFLAGFYLLDNFSSSEILWAVTAIALLLAFAANYSSNILQKFATLIFAIFCFYFCKEINLPIFKGTIFEDSSAYASYAVVDTIIENKKARVLATDRFSFQTGIFLDDEKPSAFDYVKLFTGITNLYGDLEKVLVLGGGTYSFPRVLHEANNQLNIDVVEIDPKLDNLAIKYFYFKPDAKINIIHNDARIFLNNTKEKYDIIYFDIFTSLRPPFHLTTVEAARLAKSALGEKGIVLINMIASETGQRKEFLAAMAKTYQEVFEEVYVLDTNKLKPGNVLKNYVLIAFDGRRDSMLENFIAQRELKVDISQAKVLTDDFAPLEVLLGDL